MCLPRSYAEVRSHDHGEGSPNETEEAPPDTEVSQAFAV
jgi:hypothetical protein